jgi:hypothetical protein
MDAAIPLWILAVCAIIQTLAAVTTAANDVNNKLKWLKLGVGIQEQLLLLLRQAETWANLGAFVAGAAKTALKEEATDGRADLGTEGAGKDNAGPAAGA